MKGNLLSMVALLACLSGARADTLAQWNFNSPTPDADVSTGSIVPAVGSGVATLAGGTTASFATGSTNDPAAADNSAWNTASYPAQGTNNKTAGVQFDVSTLGYENIVIRWDQRVSGTASKYYRLQYAADGATFVDYPGAIALSVASSFEAQTNDLAAMPGANNNPAFAFRIVSEFESTALGGGTEGYVTTSATAYGSSGTARFDMVTVSGKAIPGANTPPAISSVSNQTLRVEHSTGPLPLLVGDAQDPASSLLLAKASSDLSVIPEANIVFGGSGSNRTVTITAGSQPGASLVTLWVIDTGGRSNSTTFTVTVLPLNTAPVISTIARTQTLVDTMTPAIDFTISDLETPAAGLSLSGTSANAVLVPNGNILFGGSGSNRTVSLVPADGQTGVAPITLTVSDGTNSASSVFPLMVVPSTGVVFYDPFNYADGSLITNSGFLWATRSGTVGQCQVTNSQLQLCAAQTEDVIGPLFGGPYDRSNSTVLYAGFRVTFLTLPRVNPGLFAHFADGSTLRGRIYAGTTNAAPGAFRLHVANGSGTPAELASDLTTNITYTLVTRYHLDAATITLWLNPASESDPGLTATDAQTPARIASYGFRQDSDIGATLLVDDLRVGLTFGAVLPGAAITPIPLTLQLAGGNVILSWTDPAFGLQSAPSPAGAFTDVATSGTRYTNAITGPARFFRLKAR